jgi:hypothetical protein
VARLQHDPAGATARYEECLGLFRTLPGGSWFVARTLQALGNLALGQDEPARAAPLFAESLRLFRRLWHRRPIAVGLAGLGGVALRQGRDRRAARLFGSAEAVLSTLGARLPAADHAVFQRDAATLRSRLGPDAFAAACAAGGGLPPEEAITYALEPDADA